MLLATFFFFFFFISSSSFGVGCGLGVADEAAEIFVCDAKKVLAHVSPGDEDGNEAVGQQVWDGEGHSSSVTHCVLHFLFLFKNMLVKQSQTFFKVYLF